MVRQFVFGRIRIEPVYFEILVNVGWQNIVNLLGPLWTLYQY